MNKGIWFLVIVGTMFVVGCSEQKQATVPTTTTQQQVSLQDKTQAVADQAKVVAEQAKTTAVQAQANAQEVAKNVASQVQDLLAKAKSLVDSGKFDEAIAQAQEVLKLDANNADAQSIIETAKAKMTALAQQKVAEVKQGLADKFGAMTK